MDKRDRIKLEGLSFYGYHGLFESEAELGQLFKVDVTLFTDTKKAGTTDEMTDSIHYGEVYETIKGIVENKSFNLLEALSEHLARVLLEDFLLIEAVMVRVNKPQAPIPGIFDNVAVEIYRERK